MSKTKVSIRVKLALILILVTAVIFSVISWLNYQQAASILRNKIADSAENAAKHNAEVVNNWLKGIENEVVTLSNAPAIQSMDWDQQLPYLQKVAARHDDYESFVVGDTEGKAYTSATGDEEFDISSRAYFHHVKQNGEPYVGEPISSQATDELVITIAAPIKEENTTKGIILTTVTLSYLQELVQDMNIGGYGYGFIANDDMTIIAHPDKKYINNTDIWKDSDSLNEIGGKMIYGASGFDQYTFDGIKKEMAYHPIEMTGWSIAQTADTADVMGPLDVIKNLSLLFALGAIAVMLLISIVISNYIAKPIVSLNKSAQAIANGDLNQKIDAKIYSKDEIGRLAEAFTTMVNNLKSMISEIRDNPSRLVSHSQELASSSEEVSATVEENASTTSEVASTASEGAENAGTAARESEQVQQVAGEGNRAVQETIAKINSISNASAQVSESINNLYKQSEKIGEIIETITNIADQTNLLALNAAIEASRAGEHGKGFAVVAEEVRKLAEQSGSAAEEITGLIQEIQKGSGEAVNAIEHGSREVSEGVEVANNAGASLEQIKKAVEKNTSLIQDIASGIKQSSEGVQQISASHEQITSTVQQVSSSAQELANIAEELQETISRFKVDETGTAANSWPEDDNES